MAPFRGSQGLFGAYSDLCAACWQAVRPVTKTMVSCKSSPARIARIVVGTAFAQDGERRDTGLSCDTELNPARGSDAVRGRLCYDLFKCVELELVANPRSADAFALDTAEDPSAFH